MAKRDEALLKRTLIEVETQMLRHNVEGYNSVVNFLIKDTEKVIEDVSTKGNWRVLKAKLTLLQRYLNYLQRTGIEPA